jgi:hypothetical protein
MSFDLLQEDIALFVFTKQLWLQNDDVELVVPTGAPRQARARWV